MVDGAGKCMKVLLFRVVLQHLVLLVRLTLGQFERSVAVGCCSVLGQADPYLWPFDGQLRTDNTALLSINFQTNILDPDGDFAKFDMQEQNSHGKHFSYFSKQGYR